MSESNYPKLPVFDTKLGSKGIRLEPGHYLAHVWMFVYFGQHNDKCDPEVLAPGDMLIAFHGVGWWTDIRPMEKMAGEPQYVTKIDNVPLSADAVQRHNHKNRMPMWLPFMRIERLTARLEEEEAANKRLQEDLKQARDRITRMVELANGIIEA